MIGGYFNNIIQTLFVSKAVASFRIARYEEGDEDGFIRIKCSLIDRGILEFAEYIVIRKNRIHLENYSYHWQGADGNLFKRWDNVAHHKEVITFPHHLHLSDGRVIESPTMNLKKVLFEIEKVIPVNQ
jgi:hypothetical protein